MEQDMTPAFRELEKTLNWIFIGFVLLVLILGWVFSRGDKKSD